jgi:nitrite reductase (NADH) large subunit
LREGYACEWQATLEDPEAQKRFAHFINSPVRDPNVQMVSERQQHRPARPAERIPVKQIELEGESA